ncbi:exosortase N [Mucilaginibacter psychrotolerans]|uniref:Exosortase N n=1 Tax=Mucilaginibacter psychrotolerans TaxID=1524096 RepID=A0A4Y8SFA7_9SPHI|nr:exosortase N [Mucilaginibacter psychrotolerans]TFF37124.1 exosortase N [Mucilaginibacter psychrotolerans]
MFTIQLKTLIKPQPPMLFGLAYVVLALWFIPGYFMGDANVAMGALLIPYICTVDKSRRSLRYLFPALLSAVLALLLPVNTLFFVAMLFAVLLLIENTIGRVSDILLFLLLLISPVFGHVTRMGEFPVRLWLSDKVAAVLAMGGQQASAAGNQIMLGNYEFSVDQACAGLNMLVMSVLVCLFVLAFYQRQSGKALGFKWLLLLCVVTVALNIGCNFFRILLLVMFRIMPGTLFHDAVGIGCLCLYVLLPLLLGIKPMLTRFGKAKVTIGEPKPWPAMGYSLLHACLLAAVLVVAVRLVKSDSLVRGNSAIDLPGYHKTQLDGGILKFENKEALIYLKPTAFYAPEHDPMICWVGSGYVFKSIRIEKFSGHDIYTATLVKNQDRIYAAWWFDDGRLKTVNQFAWRWAAAKNQRQFYLVNINASTPQKLRQKIGLMPGQKIFNNKIQVSKE